MAYYEAQAVAPVGIGSCAACGLSGPIAVSGIGAVDTPTLIKGGAIGAIAGAGFMWLAASAGGKATKEHVKLGALFGAAVGMFSAV